MDMFHVGVLKFDYNLDDGSEASYTVSRTLEEEDVNAQMRELTEEYSPKEHEFKVSTRVISLPTRLRFRDRLFKSREDLLRIHNYKVELQQEYGLGYYDGWTDSRVHAIWRNLVEDAIIWGGMFVLFICMGWIVV